MRRSPLLCMCSEYEATASSRFAYDIWQTEGPSKKMVPHKTANWLFTLWFVYILRYVWINVLYSRQGIMGGCSCTMGLTFLSHKKDLKRWKTTFIGLLSCLQSGPTGCFILAQACYAPTHKPHAAEVVSVWLHICFAGADDGWTKCRTVTTEFRVCNLRSEPRLPQTTGRKAD